MHNPQDEECKLLNIPNDRINLHVKKNLLFLCGGGVGVRFTSDDLKNLDIITKELVELWNIIENIYKILDANMKKTLLKQSDLDNIDIDLIMTEVNNIINECKEISKIEENDKNKILIFFNNKCNNYLLKVKELQHLVKSKQESLETRGEENIKGYLFL